MMEHLAALVTAFLSSDQTLVILLLIAIDLTTGVIRALRLRIFRLQAVARFYTTQVLPGILGYVLVAVIGALGGERFPAVAGLLTALTAWAGAGLVVAALLGSITENITAAPPPRPTPPAPAP